MNIYGQDEETIIYSIYRFDKKIDDLCSTQENYQIRMLPKTLDNDLRRTIIKKQESIFERFSKENNDFFHVISLLHLVTEYEDYNQKVNMSTEMEFFSEFPEKILKEQAF